MMYQNKKNPKTYPKTIENYSSFTCNNLILTETNRQYIILIALRLSVNAYRPNSNGLIIVGSIL